MIKNLYEKLDMMIPNPKCELDYSSDYELLIATVLSAQTTDKRVNLVTKTLFKYSLEELSLLETKEIEVIIKSLGTFTRKASYVKDISRRLIKEQKGIVPNDLNYLITLPGVGRKTASVVISHLFNTPAFAVDTHVIRTSNILNLVDNDYNPVTIEIKLKHILPKNKWNKINSQLVLFGRYICKAKKPECETCLFKNDCKKKKDNS